MKIENSKLKIIFFGSSKYVLPVIQILKERFDLTLVVTTEQKETDAVPAYCLENSIPYKSVKSLSDDNFKFDPDLIGIKFQVAVLADFGLIIPKNVLDMFPRGIINIHPSLLPKFRGPTPVQSAILSGEKETGVSIIKLDNQVDHGPILAQKKEPILDEDTAETLHEKLFTKGAEILVEILPKYLTGDLIPTPQDDTKATFTEKLTRDSGYIDLSSLEIGNWKLEIARKIRAYFPWPGVWTRLKMKDGRLKIIKFLPSQSHPELDSGSSPFLLQVEGKKPMSYRDFLNGYPNVILPILQKSPPKADHPMDENTTNKK